MCDIWKSNHHLKQLTEQDITGLIDSLRKFDTKQVVMSGGEALLNPNFFRLCEILKKEGIKVTLLSTGLTIKRNAEQLLNLVNDIIVSLDGNEPVHDLTRNIPGAFRKLEEGVHHMKSLDPRYRITARTVIHRLNFRNWPDIIETAKSMGLNQVSFLPADVSSHAFNREILWNESRQHEILPDENELPELQQVIDKIIAVHKVEFDNRFIAEPPEKIRKIHQYYSASLGLGPYPYKMCNAPWISTVIEADGTVRPCFFHPAIGNIHKNSLSEILNSDHAIQFRKSLDIDTDNTCMKCVCYLKLAPRAKV